MPNQNKYDWVTDEMFENKLNELANEEDLMNIPGVYELVQEHLNNDVLKELEKEREDEDLPRKFL